MFSTLANYAKSWLPLSAEERRIQNPDTPAILGLPNELLMRVFSNLADRKDVAACRLACRDFKELSSPYLITRVVLAKRVDAMSKFYDVLQHEYFRKHVTELLYDASCYDEIIADDVTLYADARDLTLRDSKEACDLTVRYKAYVNLWDRIRGAFPEDDLLDPAVDDPEEPELEEGNHMSVWMKTYHDYKQRYEYQLRMEDTGMVSSAIKHAVDRFPRLRHVVFGDFRNLAKDAEGYNNCCERLFGDTLEPLGLSVRKPYEDDIEEVNENWEEMFSLLHVLGAHPGATVRTFTIGGHPYASSAGSNDIIGDRGSRRIPALPIRLGEDDSTLELSPTMFEAFKSMRRLQFAVKPMVSGLDDKSIGRRFIRPMLEHCAPTLAHLQLDSVKLSSDKTMQHDILKMLLFEHDFPVIRHLDLRGWKINTDDLKAFLLKLSPTLRELRLIFNLIDTMLPLARWGGDNLRLDGVQMYNYDPADKTRDRHGRRVFNVFPNQREETWLSHRPNRLPRAHLKGIGLL